MVVKVLRFIGSKVRAIAFYRLSKLAMLYELCIALSLCTTHYALLIAFSPSGMNENDMLADTGTLKTLSTLRTLSTPVQPVKNFLHL